MDAARIVCGPLSLAAEQATLQLQDRRLELDLAAAGRASWRAEGFSARFPLTSPAFSLPWPRAPWQGRCRLAVAVDGRGVWNWRLEDGALPELIDGLQAAGRMQADGDRAEVEITAWSGRWLPPVLAAVLGERQPQRIEWTGATGSLELGDDRLVVDDDGWRGVFPRDTLALLAIPGFETVEADALGERCTLVLEHRAGTLSGVLLPTSVAIDGRTPAQLMTETGAQPWAPANPEDADAAPDASTTAEDPA